MRLFKEEPDKRPDVEGIEARAKAASGEQWFAGKMRVDSNGISESLTIETYEAHEHFGTRYVRFGRATTMPEPTSVSSPTPAKTSPPSSPI